ncbi:unnamed protein product [Ectocarpus fasciculatus]
MGALLGYGEASMYREDEKLAARDRHVKHLPLGARGTFLRFLLSSRTLASCLSGSTHSG